MNDLAGRHCLDMHSCPRACEGIPGHTVSIEVKVPLKRAHVRARRKNLDMPSEVRDTYLGSRNDPGLAPALKRDLPVGNSNPVEITTPNRDLVAVRRAWRCPGERLVLAPRYQW